MFSAGDVTTTAFDRGYRAAVMFRRAAAFVCAMSAVAAAKPYPDVAIRATGGAAEVMLVQLEVRDVVVWVLFTRESQGFRLSGDVILASDRRSGKEAVTEADCVTRVKALDDDVVALLRPNVAVVPDACATAKRAVIQVARGKAPRATWLRFVELKDARVPGWYPQLAPNSIDDTETWLWLLVRRPPDVPAGRNEPPGYYPVPFESLGAGDPIGSLPSS